MAQDNTRKTLKMTGAQPQSLEEQIRYRAYQLYEARGREDGHELDDWLRAEEEITRQKSRTVAASDHPSGLAIKKRAPVPPGLFHLRPA